jgi:hypothetical protein
MAAFNITTNPDNAIGAAGTAGGRIDPPVKTA